MTDPTNGEFPPEATAGEDAEALAGDELYALLAELDRFEELVEALDEAGVETRDAAAAAGDRPLVEEMDALGVASRAAAERRMAELDQAIEAAPGEEDGDALEGRA